MFGVQTAAAEFLKRSMIREQSPEIVDRNVNRVVRLLRVFNEQLEAKAKLKGTAGQQRVVVEHVTVQPGGKAIVGSVTASLHTGGLPGGES